MSCGGGHGCGLDLALLWLWCRAVAAAPTRTLAWEPQYAMGVALKKKSAILVSDVENTRGLAHVGEGVYRRLLYFPFNFIVNVKVL